MRQLTALKIGSLGPRPEEEEEDQVNGGDDGAAVGDGAGEGGEQEQAGGQGGEAAGGGEGGVQEQAGGEAGAAAGEGGAAAGGEGDDGAAAPLQLHTSTDEVLHLLAVLPRLVRIYLPPAEQVAPLGLDLGALRSKHPAIQFHEGNE